MNCKLLEFGEECARRREKRLLPFLRMARRCSSSGAFSELRVLCVSVFLEIMSFVACWPCASGSKLLPPKVMCVRAVFFGQKRLPPSRRIIALGGLGGELFCFFGGPSIEGLFTVEAVCAKFYVSEKNVSPFSCALLSQGVLCLALHVSNDGCRVQGEKRLPPPFWHASFDFSEGVFDSYLRG